MNFEVRRHSGLGMADIAVTTTNGMVTHDLYDESECEEMAMKLLSAACDLFPTDHDLYNAIADVINNHSDQS